MAAKRKIVPTKPNDNLPWSQLTKAQQNKHYIAALLAYSRGEGENPSTKGTFSRTKAAAEKRG